MTTYATYFLYNQIHPRPYITMLAKPFKTQYNELEALGDDIQGKATLEMVAGAVAYHVARACDTQHAKSGKMDDKRGMEFCWAQAHKYTKHEFDNKGLEWLDQKAVQAAAAALVQAQLAALV